MNLIWDAKAKIQLLNVGDYIYDNFSDRDGDIFYEEVTKITRLLVANPYLGALDPFLSDRSRSYRYLIVRKRSRMIYYIDDTNQTIHIAAFWDCRREPGGQAKHLS